MLRVLEGDALGAKYEGKVRDCERFVDFIYQPVLEVDGSISCLKYDDLNPNASNHLAQRRKILRKHQ